MLFIICSILFSIVLIIIANKRYFNKEISDGFDMIGVLLLIGFIFNLIAYFLGFSNEDIKYHNYKIQYKTINSSELNDSDKMLIRDSILSFNRELKRNQKGLKSIWFSCYYNSNYKGLDTFDLSNYKLELNHK